MTAFRQIAGASLLSLAALATPALAATDDQWHYEGTVFADRDSADDIAGAGEVETRLQTRLGAGIAASRSFSTGSARTDLSFGLSHEAYPDHDRNSRTYLDAEAETVQPLALGVLSQLRYGLELREALDGDAAEQIYSRARVFGALRFTPAPRNILQLRLRLGYRNQDEGNTFQGYDQSEVLLDGMYLWAAPDKHRRLAVTSWYEGRTADYDRFSYDEAGLRLVGRQDLSETLQLVGWLGGYARDYRDGGREDRRLTSAIGIETGLSDHSTLELYTGWERNNSTYADKAFEGALAGARLTVTF
ncbi:hypothetical protein KM176_04130 [Pseudooceanicola sp. CBS1P-1]|uniref:DUF2219 family protein n=1 Tax=Pseudooceanicola albus TaxID=2692189 RepID=A0A6L7G7E8_9RHOB|nr:MULTISPECIES: hypothetical protein [Pseudooceanicola]MBT9383042.1 hypothetical protein [Pseudooceanicola endophyticus]MXN19230.1 hypothetical protein [Pseudooceanicola albus]